MFGMDDSEEYDILSFRPNYYPEQSSVSESLILEQARNIVRNCANQSFSLLPNNLVLPSPKTSSDAYVDNLKPCPRCSTLVYID